MTAAGATWMRRRSSPSPAGNGSRVEREWGSVRVVCLVWSVGDETDECWIDFYLMFGYWGGEIKTDWLAGRRSRCSPRVRRTPVSPLASETAAGHGEVPYPR